MNLIEPKDALLRFHQQSLDELDIILLGEMASSERPTIMALVDRVGSSGIAVNAMQKR